MALFLFFAVDASMGAWALFVLVTAFAGVCMGIVGVGGVVIVPAAIALLKADPKVAVASTIPGYIVTAGVGTWSYRHIITRDSATLRFACLTAAGAGSGGFFAALALHSIPSGVVATVVAIFAGGFGVKALVGMACDSGRDSQGKAGGVEGEQAAGDDEAGSQQAAATVDIDMVALSPQSQSQSSHLGGSGDSDDDSSPETHNGSDTQLSGGGGKTEAASASVPKADEGGCMSPRLDDLRSVVLGLLVGFGSALTGTSGPLLFIPLSMLMARSRGVRGRDSDGNGGGDSVALSPKVAVASAMAVGVPMALAMTLGNVLLLGFHEKSGDEDGGGVAVDLGLSLIVAVATGATVPLGAAASKRYCSDDQPPPPPPLDAEERSAKAPGNRGRSCGQKDPLLIAISLVLIATAVYILVVQFSDGHGD